MANAITVSMKKISNGNSLANPITFEGTMLLSQMMFPQQHFIE
jgi:predicted Na+-dependent transporter